MLLIRGGIHFKVNLALVALWKAQGTGGVSELFRPQKHVSFNIKALSHNVDPKIALLNVKSLPSESFCFKLGQFF